MLTRKIEQSGIDREDWWEGGTHEYTFAFHVETLELKVYLYDWEGRDHWKKQFDTQQWVTGTIDWLRHIEEAGWWHVDDLKTGAWPVDVETSLQLRTYAVVPWILDGKPADWKCLTSITWWPKYPIDGQPRRTWNVLTAFDILEHIQDIRWAHRHPEIVRPSSYYTETGKLPNCAGCGCREPFPASQWMHNFWYRTLPYCSAGLIQRVNEENE